jgi:hypothetical protein
VPVVGDRLDLLLGVADAGRDHRAAERLGAGVHDVPARRQVIGERVVHDIAGPKAGGVERPRGAPPVGVIALGFEDRPRGHQQAPQLAGRLQRQSAERRHRLLQGRQVGLAQDRQLGERGARGHRLGVDALEVRGPARRAHRPRDRLGQLREQLLLPHLRVSGLERVVELRHRSLPFQSLPREAAEGREGAGEAIAGGLLFSPHPAASRPTSPPGGGGKIR